jgi:hypothetical protein
MHTRWIAASLLTLALVASTLGAQNCKTTAADKTAVADAVRTLFAAATVDDMPKMRTVIAPNFYIFDLGHQFNSIDELMKVITSLQDEGAKFVWKVTNPRVTVHCNDAWITYLNDGSVQLPKSTTPAPTQWLESAILERQDGAWKIVFMHSTQVPSPDLPAKLSACSPHN